MCFSHQRVVRLGIKNMAFNKVSYSYRNELRQSLVNGAFPDNSISEVVDLVYATAMGGKKVFLCANGGSAANASHIVADLGKCLWQETGLSLDIRCLTDSISTNSAWANDTKFKHSFANELIRISKPSDLLIAISGSGNSKNIIESVDMGNKLGMLVTTISGFGGGKLGFYPNSVVFNTTSMQIAEDLTMITLHLIFLGVIDKWKESIKVKDITND